MKKLVSVLIAGVFAVASTAALAQDKKAEPKKTKVEAKAKSESAPILRKKEAEPASPKPDDKASRPKAPPRPKK